jgi:hypothetical protein
MLTDALLFPGDVFRPSDTWLSAWRLDLSPVVLAGFKVSRLPLNLNISRHFQRLQKIHVSFYVSFLQILHIK